MAASDRSCGPIFVLTHDSIGLGEDGPTHQPIEHLREPAAHAEHGRLAAVRCRRDRSRVARCDRAADRPDEPRSDAPGVCRTCHARSDQIAMIARGGYILCQQRRRARLDVHRDGLRGAARARRRREAREAGRRRARRVAAVHEAFDRQSAEYRAHVLAARRRKRLVIEAGATGGWWRYVGSDGAVLGIDRVRPVGAGRGVVRALRLHGRRRRRRPLAACCDVHVGSQCRIALRRHECPSKSLSTAMAGSAATFCARCTRAIAAARFSSSPSTISATRKRMRILTRHDTAHGRFPFDVEVDDDQPRRRRRPHQSVRRTRSGEAAVGGARRRRRARVHGALSPRRRRRRRT